MEEKIFLDYRYGKLCALYNGFPGKGIVIMGHGMASNKESRSNNALKLLLHKDKIATLVIDFYAHGESSGTFEDITITKAFAGLKRAYDFANEKGYGKIIISGSSFSGVIALLAGSELKITSLLLKCPVFDYKKLWEDRLGEKGLKEWKESNYLDIWGKKVGYVFYEDAISYDIRSITKKIRQPAIIIHGDADNIVPLYHAEEAYNLLSGKKELHVIHGADHFFKELPHFKEMINVAHSWIKNQLK